MNEWTLTKGDEVILIKDDCFSWYLNGICIRQGIVENPTDAFGDLEDMGFEIAEG